MAGKHTFGKITVETSNEDKVLFKDSGVTKDDLIDYYRRIADVMLDHVKGRPVTMQRLPDGLGGKEFYQRKRSDYFPKWLKGVTLKKEGGTVRHVVCEKTADLVYLADQACITFHAMLCKHDRPRRPDRMIFDIDPPGDRFKAACETARALREIVEEAGLVPHVMTTGSTGLHVVVPIRRGPTFDTTRKLADHIAELAVELDPDNRTTEQRKNKRGGRVFIDVNRNAYAQSGVAPYSVRAKVGAPVATPLDWDELGGKGLSSAKYDIKSLFRRLSQREDPWAGIQRRARSLSKAKDKLKKTRDRG